MATKRRIIKRFTPDMEKLLKRIRIKEGATDDVSGLDIEQIKQMSPEEIGEWNRELCIMEAIAYITGQKVTDQPVCVSPVIRQQAIALNDAGISDRQRAKLKTLVPKLIGTAPVIEVTTTKGVQIRRDKSDPTFKKVEKKRELFFREHQDILEDESGRVPMTKRLAILEQAADMGRFNQDDDNKEDNHEAQ